METPVCPVAQRRVNRRRSESVATPANNNVTGEKNPLLKCSRVLPSSFYLCFHLNVMMRLLLWNRMQQQSLCASVKTASWVFVFVTYGGCKRLPFSDNSTTVSKRDFMHVSTMQRQTKYTGKNQISAGGLCRMLACVLFRVVGRGNEHGLPRAGITLLTLREALCTIIWPLPQNLTVCTHTHTHKNTPTLTHTHIHTVHSYTHSRASICMRTFINIIIILNIPYHH